MIFGYPLPNYLSSLISGKPGPWNIVLPTTLFDLSTVGGIDHEVVVIVYEDTISEGTTITYNWYRDRDNFNVFSWSDYANSEYNSIAAWIGWLSQETNQTLGQNIESEITENGNYHVVVTGTGSTTFSNTINFAVIGIPAWLMLRNPTGYGFDWKVSLSDYFDTDNYIQAGICNQPFTDGQSNEPNGIVDAKYANTPGNIDTVTTGTVIGQSEGTTYTLYGFAQASNGLYYHAGTDTITTLIVTEPDVPSSPPTIVTRIEGGFELTWGEAARAVSYMLRYYPVGYFENRKFLGTNTNTGTVSSLEYGSEYSFSVYAYNAIGNSDYTSENIGTTAPKSPGNITCPLVSANDADIRVADGMSGNFDYIRVYKYDNSNNLLGYLDLSESNYNSGQRVITFSGLTINTIYKFNAVTHYTANSTLLESVNWSNDLYVTTQIPYIPSSPPIIVSRNEGSLSLSWGSSVGANSYTLRYKNYDGVYHTISGITNTTYTLNNLEYGVTYDLSVKGNNSLGSSDYTSENPGTTAPKSPGNISASTVTSTSISIQLSNGMIGNWDYIRVYAYQNSITPEYIDINKTDYDSGTRIVTWSGLTIGLEYLFNVLTYFTVDSTLLQSVNSSNDLYITIADRPINFSWDTPKISGDPTTNLLASEWTNLQNKVNEFRQYKSLSNYSFTNVISGGIFYASIFNEVRNNIYPMNSIGLPSTKVGISDVVDPNDADYILASDLNNIVSCLNAIE